MTREAFTPPTERINIKYKTDDGGMTPEVELPFRLLVVGDFTGKDGEEPIEKRKAIDIDKNTFQAVLAGQNVSLDMKKVPNVLSGKQDDVLQGTLKIKSLKDFEPDAIAEQVEELKELLEVRKALTELKGPLAQNAQFRRQLQDLLNDLLNGKKERSILDHLEMGAEKTQ